MPKGSARKVAIVTGASSGIGAATAVALARAGYDVVVGFNTNATGAEAVAGLCRAAGATALVHQGDVARDAHCQDLAAAASKQFGRLDALVNNAGTSRVKPGQPLEGLEEADIDHLFAVNLRSAFQMSRAAATALKSTRGTIVNVSSHSAFSGFGSSLIYAATKGAMNTLTLGLARKLAPEIRVNAVCPGFVATDWLKKVRGISQAEQDELLEGFRQAAPLQIVATAEDVAEAVVWFVTGARSITGQLLVIDGGAHLAVVEPRKPERR